MTALVQDRLNYSFSHDSRIENVRALQKIVQLKHDEGRMPTRAVQPPLGKRTEKGGHRSVFAPPNRKSPTLEVHKKLFLFSPAFLVHPVCIFVRAIAPSRGLLTRQRGRRIQRTF